MTRILAKILITSLVVVGISELGKRFSLFGALLASLPITSILAMIWLFQDTSDVTKAIFPMLLKSKMNFTPALILSCTIMVFAYAAYVKILPVQK